MTPRAGVLAVTLVVIVAAALAPSAWSRLVRPLDRAVDPSLTVADRDGRALRVFLSSDGSWRLPADPDRLDPLYLAMLLAVEDKRFHGHPGSIRWPSGGRRRRWSPPGGWSRARRR